MPTYTHIAYGRWPEPQLQMDWVDSLIVMEHWLNTNIGVHAWKWAPQAQKDASQAVVAFINPKHKTLFLLRWA